jgi:hypothetical protein
MESLDADMMVWLILQIFHATGAKAEFLTDKKKH